MIPPFVMWCDPGLMTGLSWLWAGGICHYAAEWDFDGAADQIERSCEQLGPQLSVGWEAYHIRVNLPQTHAHTAIEMTGVIKRYARKHGCVLLEPADPAERKKATRAMLVQLGWWVPGKDDAQSAAQHMLAWLMRTGNLPPHVSAVVSEAVRTI